MEAGPPAAQPVPETTVETLGKSYLDDLFGDVITLVVCLIRGQRATSNGFPTGKVFGDGELLSESPNVEEAPAWCF